MIKSGRECVFTLQSRVVVYIYSRQSIFLTAHNWQKLKKKQTNKQKQKQKQKVDSLHVHAKTFLGRSTY